jgi:hypothetical protein
MGNIDSSQIRSKGFTNVDDCCRCRQFISKGERRKQQSKVLDAKISENNLNNDHIVTHLQRNQVTKTPIP